jgi:hypothetical protein
MSQYSSKDIGFVLIDGYSVVGTLTTLQDSVEAILQESLAYGDTWGSFVSTGIRKGALSQGGYFDDTVGSVHDALNGTGLSSLGDSRVLVYGLEGNTVGAQFVGYGGALEAKYERVLALEKLHMANAMYNPSGAIELGQVLKTLAAVTADGDTTATSVDQATNNQAPNYAIVSNTIANPTIVTTLEAHGLIDNDVVVIAGVVGSDPDINGAQVVTVTGAGGVTKFSVPVNVTTGGTGGRVVRAWTKDGGSAFVSCSALSLGGYTNLAPTILHSADNITFADLVVMTVITAAPAAERKTVAAGTTVNRYLAALWAFTGGGGAHSATFMVGFSRA